MTVHSSGFQEEPSSRLNLAERYWDGCGPPRGSSWPTSVVPGTF